MFICGFGQVFLAGRVYLTQVDENWRTTHLGYLTEDQYEFAHQWALRSIGQEKVEGAVHDYDYQHLRAKVLTRLGGNVAALQRLLERERGRNPGCRESVLYERIIEQLERDQR